MFKLLKYFKKGDWFRMVIFFITTILQIAMTFVIPTFIGLFISSFQQEPINIPTYVIICFVGSALFSIGILYFNLIFSNYICSRFSLLLRQKIFEKSFLVPLDSNLNNIIYYCLNDTGKVSNLFASFLNNFVQIPLLIVFTFIFIFIKIDFLNIPIFIFAIILGIIALICIVSLIVFLCNRTNVKNSTLCYDKNLEYIRETINTYKLARTYNAHKYHEEKTKYFLDTSRKVNSTMMTLGSVLSNIFSIFMSVTSIIIFFVGTFVALYGNSSLSFADLAKFSLIGSTIVSYFASIVSFFFSYFFNHLSVKKIRNFLNSKEINNYTGIKEMTGTKGTIEFKNVTYSDGGNVIINDVSFYIKSNEFVALVGPTGAGKTTILKLILGFIKPNKGKILINGYDIETIDSNALRSVFSYSAQKSHMFKKKIKENIGYSFIGEKLEDMELVMKASEQSASHDFITKLKEQYDTQLSEATSLSGGQKQRISIASVLAINPNLVIFDESTSMLDPNAKEELKNLMYSLKKNYNKTIISVTHDMEEVTRADKILIMSYGKLIKITTPEEIFNDKEFLLKYKLDVPFSVNLLLELKKHGINIDYSTNIKTIVKKICQKK